MRLQLGVVLAGLFCLIAAPALAQDGVQAGPLGGLNVASIVFEDLEDGGEFTTSPITRFAAGGFVEIPITRMFSIQPEVLYAVKGVRLADDVFDESFALTLRYIEIPILFRTNVQTGGRARPFVVAGPVFGIKAGKAKVGSYEGEFEDAFDVIADDVAAEIDDDIASTDVGITVGGGVALGRLIVEGRFQFGVRDINRTAEAGASPRTRSFLVLVGAGFGS